MSAAGAAVPKAAGQATARRRVLMVTYDFPPSSTMGAQACAQLARYLPRYGWTPIVLTVRERHIEDRDAVTKPTPLGPIVRSGVIPHPLTTYRHLKTRLVPRARVGVRPGGEGSRPKTGRLRRWVLSLLWIPDPYAGWILPAVVAGLRAIRRHRIGHIFSSAPHSTNHLVGLALARLTGLPWTAHFRDPWIYPWAQWQHAKPVSALSARIETALERMVVRRADAVVCVTEPHTNWLRERYRDVPSGKFVTVPNGFDGAEWETLATDPDGRPPMSADTFVICYAGNLYHLRSPLPLFRALRSLIHAGEVARERIRVDLIGRCDVADGASVREVAAACELAGCVNITGPLGRAETLRRVADSDLLLLLAEELIYQIPGKTYEYLRAERPILALTSEGALADLLRRTGGAWVVDPANEAGVAAAVHEAYRLWKDGVDGPRPDRDVVAGFDRRVLAGRLADVFETPPCAALPAR